MFCMTCGQQISDENTAFCPHCGAKVNSQPSQTEQAAPSLGPASTPAQPVYPAYQQPQYPKPAPKKKKHGCLIALLVVVLVLGGAVLAAYLFVPGLLRPYDLGVSASAQAYESAMKKLGYEKDQAPQQGMMADYQYVYGDPQSSDVSLTSEEITSFLNINRPPYYAIKNVQFRINPDGTVEASASLDVSYILDEMLGGQYSKADAERELPMLGLIPNTINIYGKFSGKVENNEVVKMSIDQVGVMGISLPQSLFDRPEVNSFMMDAINENIQKAVKKQKSSVDLLEVKNGALIFKGKIPSSIARRRLK